MVVDCHIHARDFDEAYKETVSHALYVAKKAGVSGIFAMPNTKPSLTDEKTVRDYLRLADNADTKGVFFGVYMALTADSEQVKKAVDVHRKLFPRVVGFKLYAGHSTNNIGVIREEDQRAVFETLARQGYEGVVFVHAEKESLMDNSKFIKTLPKTHSTDARPPQAEVASIMDMINFSGDAGFKGKLHIAHISTPEGVELVYGSKKSGRRISCGATPHHLRLNQDLMNGYQGVAFKVNPPLRAPEVPGLLLSQLEKGMIDVIETDNAPHAPNEKLDCSGPCLSGLTSSHAWPLFRRWLCSRLNWSDADFNKPAHDNVVDLFEVDIPYSKSNGEYDPDAYSVNSWKGLERMLE